MPFWFGGFGKSRLNVGCSKKWKIKGNTEGVFFFIFEMPKQTFIFEQNFNDMPMTITAQHTAPVTNKPKKVRRMTLKQFWEKYSDREDGYKYEFINGIVEKTPRRMKLKEAFISQNIKRAFTQTETYKVGGELFEEMDIETLPEQGRRPDICFLTKQQIKMGSNVALPSFIIEVISDTDGINRVNDKLVEYFEVGVAVVWHVFPKQEMVYVYTSVTNVMICRGDSVCSAAPAVADFQMSANAIFIK